MTKAEERALEKYPYDYPERTGFREGYEQAEKDLVEWVEEQLAILDKQTLLHPDDDVFWGQRNAYKQIKDKLNSL